MMAGAYRTDEIVGISFQLLAGFSWVQSGSNLAGAGYKPWVSKKQSQVASPGSQLGASELAQRDMAESHQRSEEGVSLTKFGYLKSRSKYRYPEARTNTLTNSVLGHFWLVMSSANCSWALGASLHIFDEA